MTDILDEMVASSKPATLKALSVYASCTRKRIEQMESGVIIPRRNYFIRGIQWILDSCEVSRI